METSSFYPKGSEWRKWDLHAHTPLDPEWMNAPELDAKEEKENFAKNYIEFAINQNLSVIGITNHNFCNELEDLILPYIQEEAFKNNITILPGFEITANEGNGIHLLVLFPEDTELKNIKSVIDQCFEPTKTKIPKNGQVPLSDKSIDELKTVLNKSNLDHLIIFAHVNSENGVLDKNTASGEVRKKAWQKDYINIAQLTKGPEEFEENNFISKVINSKDPNYERNIAYILASDCRQIEEKKNKEGRNYLGEKFTWIKADPTFEGLKQIVYEPEERTYPYLVSESFINNKPHFSSILIEKDYVFKEEENSAEFDSCDIPLNPNMVAVVGGRGTGKSLLLDSFAKTFNKNLDFERINRIELNNDNFLIKYKKLDESLLDFYIQEDENNLDYLHISQGEVKDKVKNPQKLDNEIKALLNISPIDFNAQPYQEELEKKINEIFDNKEWLNYTNENHELINSIEYNEKKKKEYDRLLSTITTEDNQEIIKKYTENLTEIGNARETIKKVEKLRSRLKEDEEDRNKEINEINSSLENEENQIPLIDFSSQYIQIAKIIKSTNLQIDSLNSSNKEIEEDFKRKGINEDLSTLFENIEKYQFEKQQIEEKIKEAKERLDSINKSFESIFKGIKNIHLEKQKVVKSINDKWNELQKGKDDWNNDQIKLIQTLLEGIEIEASESFDKHLFYDKISEYLNLQKFRSTQQKSRIERLTETFQISNADDFLRFLSNQKKANINGHDYLLENLTDTDLFNSKDQARDFLKLLYLPRNHNDFWKVISFSKYKNKRIDQLSVGQRGTFYVCLKLATAPFSQPFVFDQPEDDLDNEFIVADLVPIFKKIKKYRQVLIVTHNANLVVNADAEQVVIANNIDECLSYNAGAIENPFIRDQICSILEGGREAFEKRERKYDFGSL